MAMKSTSWLKLFVSISGAIILFPFIVCAQTPIDCGVNTAGSISVVGEQDNFTFTGGTGDVVTIRVRKTSGTLIPYLELYDPSNNRIGNPSPQIDATLAASGTFRILVRDQNNTRTGDYVVYWQKVNNACNITADLLSLQRYLIKLIVDKMT